MEKIDYKSGVSRNYTKYNYLKEEYAEDKIQDQKKWFKYIENKTKKDGTK